MFSHLVRVVFFVLFINIETLAQNPKKVQIGGYDQSRSDPSKVKIGPSVGNTVQIGNGYPDSTQVKVGGNENQVQIGGGFTFRPTARNKRDLSTDHKTNLKLEATSMRDKRHIVVNPTENIDVVLESRDQKHLVKLEAGLVRNKRQVIVGTTEGSNVIVDGSNDGSQVAIGGNQDNTIQIGGGFVGPSTRKKRDAQPLLRHVKTDPMKNMLLSAGVFETEMNKNEPTGPKTVDDVGMDMEANAKSLGSSDIPDDFYNGGYKKYGQVYHRLYPKQVYHSGYKNNFGDGNVHYKAVNSDPHLQSKQSINSVPVFVAIPIYVPLPL